MRDDRLREILSIGPGAEEARRASSRARKRAIAEYEAGPRRRSWRPALAAGLAMLLIAGAWVIQRPADRDAAGPAAQGGRIEMRLQLSDGTRVNWVVDDRYAL